MTAVLYEIALWCLAIIALPKLLYQRFTSGKYKESLPKRMGFDLPSIDRMGKPLIWIHACSLGETKMIQGLAKKLKKHYPQAIIVVSSITETGHAEAKKNLSFCDHHFYLPLDSRFIISPLVRQIRPDLVILAELELWYNFLDCCKRHGADVVLVNGKISERSTHRFQYLPFFTNKLLSFLDLACVQNKIYQQRFQHIGLPLDRMVVTGNMKFDSSPALLSADQLSQWKKELGINQDNLVLVFGSTHETEEELILDMLPQVFKAFPQLKVLIVPRYPERFHQVAELIAHRNFSFIRLSDLMIKTGKEQIILVDAMGLLNKCYQLATLAVVCGSYTPKVGGHNIIEPCWFGVPVFFGPCMASQPELVSLVTEYQAGLEVPSAELPNMLISYLSSPEKLKQMGDSGTRLISAMQGSTDRTLQAMNRFTNRLTQCVK